jgi:hypothetical protein
MSDAARYSEAARLRRDDADAADARTRTPLPAAPGAPCRVVQTFTESTYPTAAAEFFACHPVTVLGTETEGAAGDYTVDSGTTIYVLNLGPTIPASGTKVIATFVDYRWVTRVD